MYNPRLDYILIGGLINRQNCAEIYKRAKSNDEYHRNDYPT